MKKMMKKAITLLVTVCILLSVLSIGAYAAGSSIAFSNSKPTLNETFTVTGRISAPSGDKIYALEAFLTYDASVIEFVSGDSCNLLTNGKVKIIVDSSENTISVNVKFKAKAAGKSTVALESIKYVGNSDSEQTLSGSSAIITVTNPSAQASSDANLKNLSVSAGTLTPTFHPDVTSYNVTIDNTVTELWLQAVKSNANSTYTVDGSKDMKVGYNKRVIIVTAENGNTKSYTVNVIRLDENGNPPAENNVDVPVNDFIEVDVNGTAMYVGEDFSAQTLPKNFNVIDYAFEGKTIPALSDDNYVLIYLVMPDGSDSGFYVVDKKGKFVELITLEMGEASFYILPADKTPKGYIAVDGYEIFGIPVPAFKSTEGSSEFFMVYAKGPGGQVGFYNFDTVDQTLQRATTLTFADEEKDTNKDKEENEGPVNIVETFNALNVNGKIVAITIPAIILLLIAAIIVLIVKIVTAGKNRDYDYDYDDSDDDDDDNLGFDFISTSEPSAPPIVEESGEVAEEEVTLPEEIETTEEAEEVSEEEEE